MSTPRRAVAPHVVDAKDVHIRRAAAWTVWKAYLTAPQAWLFCLTEAVLGTLFILVVTGPYASGWLVVATGVVLFAGGLAAYAAVTAATAYFTPRLAKRRLCYTATAAAAAAVMLRADPRRGAELGDVQGHAAGAWPKGRGAGGVLDEWVRAMVHAEGGRVTLTATSLLAPMYRRRGYVDDGRTVRFLVRLASKPRRETTTSAA